MRRQPDAASVPLPMPPYDIVVQPDGKLLVGGFSRRSAVRCATASRAVDANGALDAGFNPDVNGSVSSVALQADGGSALVGGEFTQINGQARHRLARLHGDGTLDAGFDPDADGGVYGPAVQGRQGATRRIFRRIGGVLRGKLARLHADGSVERTFDPAANNTLAAAAGGCKVLVGGPFTQLRAIAQPPSRVWTRTARLMPASGSERQRLGLQRALSSGKLLVAGISTDRWSIAQPHRTAERERRARCRLQSSRTPTAAHSMALQTDLKGVEHSPARAVRAIASHGWTRTARLDAGFSSRYD